MNYADRLAKQQRRRLQTLSGKNARVLVANIVAQLDGVEWNSDTCSRIAETLRTQGFTFSDP